MGNDEKNYDAKLTECVEGLFLELLPNIDLETLRIKTRTVVSFFYRQGRIERLERMVGIVESLEDNSEVHARDLDEIAKPYNLRGLVRDSALSPMHLDVVYSRANTRHDGNLYGITDRRKARVYIDRIEEIISLVKGRKTVGA